MDITQRLDIYSADNPNLMCENESYIRSMSRQLKSVDWPKVKKRLKSNANKFVDFAQKAGVEKEVLGVINKYLRTNFKSLDDIINLKLLEAPIMGISSDDVMDQWSKVKDNLYDRLSFVRFSDAFMDMNKAIGKSGIHNPSATVFYTLLWVALQTGKLNKKK